MELTNGHLRHFGAVTTLVQAARDHRYRSVAVAGLYSNASALAAGMALDICQSFSVHSTFFHFEDGHHRWRQFRPHGIEVYNGAQSKAAPPKNRYSALALETGPTPPLEGEPEVELVEDAPFSLVRATVEELAEESSMLVLSAPPLLADPSSLRALSIVPRVILVVPSKTDRTDLTTAQKSLEAANVELLGTIMTDYQNPLPKWLDFLLGYR